MSLYLKHRPPTLEEVKGNTNVVQAIGKMLSDKENFPHAVLLTGETGCGKTTLARIIAKELGCKGNDLIEMNASDHSGIDDVRDIIRNSSYMPIESSCRVWVIDECFSKNTPITLSSGEQTPIQNIKEGDTVLNLVGGGKVNHTFINKVDLDRVVCVNLQNKKQIVCSEDHLFFTPNGWVKAKNLDKKFVYLNISSIFVPNNDKLNILKNERSQILPVMWERIKNTKSVLFLQMFKSSEREYKTFKKRNTSLFTMRETSYLFSEQGSKSNFLQSKLWRKIQISYRRYGKIFVFPRSKTKSKNSTEKFYDFPRRCSFAKEKFRKNEIAQHNNPIEYREGTGNKKNKREFACLERATGWEWNIHTVPSFTCHSIGVANGSCASDWQQTERQFRIPDMLQSRYRESSIENINRSGWQITQLEKGEIERLKKRRKVETVGVENVTFYKYRNNDKSFTGVITDTERNQGFVEFYDLEITNHPSYYANGVLVHNCHRFKDDAQNCWLKLLEDTPKHVYFILCTTDPQKLKDTIKGRCQQFQMKPLTDAQMFSLLRRIVKDEGETLEQEVYDQIIQDSLCHPRNGIQILEQVLAVAPEKRLETAKQTAELQSQAIELCRALIKHENWNKVNKILTGLKGQEEETIRRIVLGYCSAILLKEENDRAGLIMEEMIDPFYNCGFSGLVFKCYTITKN